MNVKLRLCFVFVLGLALRLYQLESESFGIDETYAESYLNSTYLNAISGNIEPLYFLFIKIWSIFFGSSEFSLRFTSVLFGSLAILAIYFLALEILNPKPALVAAFLLAINPFAIYSSQNVRFDTFFHLLSLLSSYYFLRVFKSEDFKKSKHYIFFTTCALHSHPYSFFFYIGQIAIFIALKYFNYIKTSWRVFIDKNLFVVLLCAPIILSTIYLTINSYVDVGHVDIPKADFSTLFITLARYFFDVDYGTFVVLMALLLFLVILLKNSFKLEALLWIGGTVFGTLVLPWLISQVFMSIYYYRFTSVGLTAVIFFMSLAITASNNFLTYSLCALILILNLSPLFNYYLSPNNDLWREASQHLSSHLEASDLIVTEPAYLEDVLKHHLSDKYKNKIINSVNLDYLKKEIASAQRLWIVQSYGFFNQDLNRILSEFGNESNVSIVASELSNHEKIVAGYPIRISMRKRKNIE